MARRTMPNASQLRELRTEVQCGILLLVCGLFYLCVGTIMVAPMKNVAKEKENIARHPLTVGIIFLCVGGFMICGSIFLWCRDFALENYTSGSVSHDDLYHALEFHSHDYDRSQEVESRLPHRTQDPARGTPSEASETQNEAYRTRLHHLSHSGPRQPTSTLRQQLSDPNHILYDF